MKKIRKAVIPAAGFGTRFLPATKAIPKEMLPIVDKPTIQYIVEEAVQSGIEEILIITNSYKSCIEDHFDHSFELEEKLKASNDKERLNMVEDIANMVNLYSVRQKNPRGLGHAVLCAESFVGDEPFAVLLGDDIVVNEHQPAIQQLMEAASTYNGSMIGVQPVSTQAVHKYGIIAPSDSMADNVVKLAGMVEKPQPQDAPSNLAVMGRYILEPQIFSYLKNQTPGAGNEIQLTDAIARMATERHVYACEFFGKRYDVGDKVGFLQAQIDFALARDDLHDAMMEIISTYESKRGCNIR